MATASSRYGIYFTGNRWGIEMHSYIKEPCCELSTVSTVPIQQYSGSAVVVLGLERGDMEGG